MRRWVLAAALIGLAGCGSISSKDDCRFECNVQNQECLEAGTNPSICESQLKTCIRQCGYKS